MVKEIQMENTNGGEKVLVCITAQSNSARLIYKGAQIADQCDGELHILHVQKGDSIFHNQETPALLQKLFLYGSQLGGMVHAYCEENIPKSIAEFIKKEHITRLVLGEPPSVEKLTATQIETQFSGILNHIPKTVEVIIVPRIEEEVSGR